ncbi:MAG: cation transporter [Gammaproteobacteria bacterium]|nr:cation transporter [Gammaproteobacteria bacterium]
MASGSKKVIYAALIGNGLIAITKFIASALTGSSAMFSEGVHSLVDTGNQGLLLHGLRRARKPASKRFPFGHGKEVYFWSFTVAVLIFGVGAGVSLYEGIHQLSAPHAVTNPHINYIVLGLAIVFEGVAWTFAFVEFNRSRGDLGFLEAVSRGKDPTLFAVLFEDSAAMLGLIIALGGVAIGDLTGNWIYDGVASVLIGLVLAAVALWLAYETKGLLIGEAAMLDVVDGIRSIVENGEHVETVNEVLTMHMGPEYVLLNVSVEFFDQTRAPEMEAAIAAMDQEIKAAYPVVKRIFVEAEASRDLALRALAT